MAIGIADALSSLRPSSPWRCGNTYASIEWLDESQTIPTEQEVLDEITRLEQEYSNNAYQRLRANAYPTIQEQLDMQYWDSVNGTTTWKDAIATVKSSYPKPD